MTENVHIPILALGIDDAARSIGIARSAIYQAVAKGEIASFKLGRRRMIQVKELERYIGVKAKEGAR